MTPANENTQLTALAVSLGRIEEMLKGMNEKLDKLEATNETHADVLRKHEVAIRLLEQRQGPKIHWTGIVGPLLGIVALIAAYVTYIVK